jgi:hypothetical protein
MEIFYCKKHNCGGTERCSKCASQANHPAGKGRTIHDEVWAISTSLRLGAEQERARIIAILEAELTYKEHDLRVFLIDKINGAV